MNACSQAPVCEVAPALRNLSNPYLENPAGKCKPMFKSVYAHCPETSAASTKQWQAYNQYLLNEQMNYKSSILTQR